MNELIHYENLGTPAAVTATADDLLAAFLGRRSAATRRAYDADLRDFAAFLGLGTPAEGLRRLLELGQAQGNGKVLAYVQTLRDRALSPATVNRRLAALRSALKLARTLGMAGWRLEVEGEHARSYRNTKGPGTGGMRGLLAAARTEAPALLARDVAILRLLFDVALRRGEVVALDLEHLDLADGRVWILGKGRADREAVSLPAPTCAALEAWLEVRGTEPGPLFMRMDRAGAGERMTGEAVRLLVARLSGKAGLGLVRPHGLRHAAITAALDAGETLRAVQRFARHADPRTTIKYDDNHKDLAGKVALVVAGAVA